MDESIIEALKKIQAICTSQLHCKDCVFGDKRDECLICDNTPEKWDINEDLTIRYLK